MRVLVCGGRDYNDTDRMVAELNRRLKNDPALTIIVGYDPESEKFQGADQLAYEWAKATETPVLCFPAKWGTFGVSGPGDPAGPIRNGQMLSEGRPHYVVAFKGGRGTRSMMTLARRAGVKVADIA